MRFPYKAAMIWKQVGSVWLSHRLAGLLSHSREAFRRFVIGPAEVGCDFVKQYLDDLVRQGKVLYVGSRMPGLVDRAGEHSCALAGVVGLHRVADRIQLDRANRRAGTDPDGQGAEPWLACVVATGSWRADRQTLYAKEMFGTFLCGGLRD